MFCDVLAGWISGMLGFAVGHPIDTVKVQQQVQGTGVLKSVKYIYDVQGIRGYYRGMFLPFLANGVLNAVFFGIYGPVCDKLVERRQAAEESEGDENSQQTNNYRNPYFKGLQRNVTSGSKSENVESTYGEMFLAGCIAGAVQLGLSTPIELVKVKLQSQFRYQVFSGPSDCFTKILKDSGIKGLYRGLVPMAIRNLVGAGINFTVMYHYLQGISPEALQFREKFDFWSEILPAAGISGIVSWWIVIPFDVIKSRMQADNHKSPRYKGMRHCATDIVERKGVKGLFRGFWTAAFRAFPVNAASFLAYQFILDECRVVKRTINK